MVFLEKDKLQQPNLDSARVNFQVNPELSPQVNQVKQYFLKLQDTLCQAFTELEQEGQKSAGCFKEDLWQHPETGGGATRILEQGFVFERAGVNYSCIQGKSLPHFATEKRPELKGCEFLATGVSVVLHPNNPYVPTTHFNVRFFTGFKEGQEPIWWFGGGFDLTPYYPFEEDCIHWHKMAKQACLPFGIDVYPKFKKWCDEYFYLKHRKETRGIGGLFFDDLNHWSFETCLEFIQSISEHFVLGYLPIVKKRKDMLFGQRERDFQTYRRGRYIEFNLLYDRGTLFGLQSGGRTESILMSLPPQVQYKYCWQPEAESLEALLYERYLKAREWIE